MTETGGRDPIIVSEVKNGVSSAAPSSDLLTQTLYDKNPQY